MHAALVAAEQRMKAGSRDPEAFRAAKAEREYAAEAIERLEWAEKAEQERQAEAERQEKAAKLCSAQARAQAAHDRAREIGADIRILVDTLAEKVRELAEAQSIIDRGVHYESFALRDGYLDRPTVIPRLNIDSATAVMALRATRELAKLAGMSVQAAEIRAAQGRL